MEYFSSFLNSLLTSIFIIFLLLAAGYYVGRISIKGISLGTAGILFAALLFGVIASYIPYFTVGGRHIVLFLNESLTLSDGTTLAATKGTFSLLSSLGTVLFIAAVGLTAGPKFFRTFNKSSLGYILLGVIIIMTGSLVAIAILLLSKDPNVDSSLIVGLMTGALTSTPGLAAAKDVAADEAKCTAGYGIGYLFGVLGVVLFVQILPRLLRADMDKERAAFAEAAKIQLGTLRSGLRSIEPFGLFPFAVTVVFGCFLGCIKIPGINFSLGSSGGTLIAGLIIGHFGHIGNIDCRVKKETLRLLQELGLCLFLIGAGVPGGINFVSNVKLSYFFFGALITLIPMIIGYILSRKLFQMSLFNSLGAITGGMTSTPALGALIAASGIDDVTGPYAATYPFALLSVVLAARIIASVM